MADFCDPYRTHRDPRCPFREPHKAYDVRCPVDREYLEGLESKYLLGFLDKTQKYNIDAQTIRWIEEYLPIKILEEASQ